MSVGKEWEIPLRQTQSFVPRIVFRCGSTKTPIQKNHYLRDKGLFPGTVTYSCSKYGSRNGMEDGHQGSLTLWMRLQFKDKFEVARVLGA